MSSGSKATCRRVQKEVYSSGSLAFAWALFHPKIHLNSCALEFSEDQPQLQLSGPLRKQARPPTYLKIRQKYSRPQSGGKLIMRRNVFFRTNMYGSHTILFFLIRLTALSNY